MIPCKWILLFGRNSVSQNSTERNSAEWNSVVRNSAEFYGIPWQIATEFQGKISMEFHGILLDTLSIMLLKEGRSWKDANKHVKQFKKYTFTIEFSPHYWTTTCFLLKAWKIFGMVCLALSSETKTRDLKTALWTDLTEVFCEKTFKILGFWATILW